jgi:hypothetical protein
VTRGKSRQAGVPTVRCSHVAYRTQRRCRLPAVVGTTVCHMHAGAARHVARKADERMTLAQVMQHDARPLGEVLLDATHVADSLMRDLKTQVLANGEPVDPDLLMRLVEATRLAHHLAETSVRTGVQVELVRRARLSREADAAYVTHVLGRVLDALLGWPRGALAPLGADALDALRLWVHEVVRLELEAVEEPDLARADPDRPPELTGAPAAYPPPPVLPAPRREEEEEEP